MRILFPIIFSAVIIIIFGLLQLLFFKFFNRDWWAKKWIRIASGTLPVFGIMMLAVWGYGEYHTLNWLAFPAATLAVLTFILEICLFISLPFSGIIHFVQWGVERLSKKRRERQPAYINQQRRVLIKTAAAVVPMITLTTGAFGVVRAMSGVRVFKKPIHFENLPSDLDGFRVLHLSDMHLRHYVTLEDLEGVLTQAERFSPDLTLVTGDIADDLKLLPEALRLIDQLKPPYGSYASLGNHEYFRGIAEVIRNFNRSVIPLLINAGDRIKIGAASLFIGGLDDPRSMGAKPYEFFRAAVNATLTEKNDHDFVILMSHRPDALDYASKRKVALTLAGHTHGGQIGFANRSLFESMWPERYLWGHYNIEKSHLYTSSGVGHWFPFRLGCPPEAPVIELRKS